jgi:F-type H+/Na+-transporting ATPase subunit alpha
MKTDTILKNLKDRIENFESKSFVSEVGTVVEVYDSVVKISGLTNVMASELLVTEKSDLALALNLEEDYVGAILINPDTKVKEGDIVKRTNSVLSVPVGSQFLGRVADPLMRPLDGLGEIEKDAEYLVEKKAPNVMEREPVNVPLLTGIKSIDSMIPIGRGQRELIIGDRQTGKTSIAIDTIINQKGKDVVCVYVAIGQKKSKTARVINTLKENGALPYTIVVLAGSSDGPTFSYMAPYSGTAVAEYFMDQGKDVLVVYDDLSKHAVAYREISLLLRRPPGREAFPGDVFYLHSRLLERASRRSSEFGGGSITALPIIETQAGDISAYIPTNVISITDGQIFLESNLFNKGVRPAINIGLSVSRVGGSAQIKSMKKASGRMKLDLAQYRELESFAQFASDLDEETKKVLNRGKRITELLKQENNKPMRVGIQVLLFYAVNNGYLDEVKNENIQKWQEEISKTLTSSEEELLSKIESDWTPEIEAEIKEFLEGFNMSVKNIYAE